MVQVVHVAHQQCHFVGGCRDRRRHRGTLTLFPASHITLQPPQGPLPLLDGISPYSWLGLPGSGESAKREMVATAPSTAMGQCHHLHLPPSPSCQGAPEAKSRGPGQHKVGSGGSSHGAAGLRSTQGAVGWGAADAEVTLTDLHIHLLAPQLVKEVEHTTGVRAPLSCRHQLHLQGMESWDHRATPCCATPCPAAPCPAAPCRATQCQTRALQHLEPWSSCTLHGAPVPEPLVLRRWVPQGSALQHQRVPLGQAARLWLLQDLQPRHAGAVTAGCGWEGRQIGTRPWQGCSQLASAPQCPAGAVPSPRGQ